jgi:hypothetical protein
MKTKITKIVLEVGGKKLEFTTDEAKELKSILTELFGGERTVYVDRWHWPYYHATTPVPYHGTVWCGSIQGTTALFSASSQSAKAQYNAALSDSNGPLLSQ